MYSIWMKHEQLISSIFAVRNTAHVSFIVKTYVHVQSPKALFESQITDWNTVGKNRSDQEVDQHTPTSVVGR